METTPTNLEGQLSAVALQCNKVCADIVFRVFGARGARKNGIIGSQITSRGLPRQRRKRARCLVDTIENQSVCGAVWETQSECSGSSYVNNI